MLERSQPCQNLDVLEVIRKVPRTDGLGLDVVFQVPWDLGLPEEDHALRAVKPRVSVGVMLQMCGAGHIRKLKQLLTALSVQFVESIAIVIVIS